MFAGPSVQRRSSVRAIYGTFGLIRCSSRNASQFVPRQTFPLPTTNFFSWFPGHMFKALRELASTVNEVDLIVEIRDARIPLSSRNPYFDDVCAGKRRLILYNKRNLAGLTEEQEQVHSDGIKANCSEFWDGL